MRLCVIGLGHVGCVAAAVFARAGHVVIGVESDAARAATVAAGRSPVGEPGLDAALAEAVAAGRLSVVSDLAAPVQASELSLICVGTPAADDGSLDHRAVLDAYRTIASAAGESVRRHVVIIGSTVAPGTAAALASTPGSQRCPVVVNPEFLREGSALADFADPPFVLAGTDDHEAAERVAALYAPLGQSITRTTADEACMVKLASNAFHAAKVTFANEIGAICSGMGINGARVMELFRQDTRLNASGAYLRPGFAYGGPCLSKDLAALVQAGIAHDAAPLLLPAVAASNAAIITRAVRRIVETGAGRVGLLGLSFKASVSDRRGSPLVELALRLREAGVEVSAFDPAPAPPAVVSGVTLRASLDELIASVDVMVVSRAELMPADTMPARVRVLDLDNLG